MNEVKRPSLRKFEMRGVVTGTYLGGLIIKTDDNTGKEIQMETDMKLDVGKRVIILAYRYEGSETSKSKTIYGLVEEATYDNPIRESQKLPKGWRQEPTIKELVAFGVIERLDTFNERMLISILISEKQKDQKPIVIDNPDIDYSKFYEGQIVLVIGKYTFTNPDGVEFHDVVKGPFDGDAYIKGEKVSNGKDDPPYTRHLVKTL